MEDGKGEGGTRELGIGSGVSEKRQREMREARIREREPTVFKVSGHWQASAWRLYRNAQAWMGRTSDFTWSIYEFDHHTTKVTKMVRWPVCTRVCSMRSRLMLTLCTRTMPSPCYC